jgi:3-deoxy-manno-octulosonate cytidylyltransferase (CMP-KDO synthetase)
MHPQIIIPARYGSTRFPGKPLALVAGVPLLQRVWALAASVAGRDGVTVATDDTRIADFCRAIGAQAVMTATDLPNGTARAAAALSQLDASIDAVINLQGDAVLTPPWVLAAMLAALRDDPAVLLVTPAVRLSRAAYESLKAAKDAGEVGGTTVVFDQQYNALYFSKSIIPYVRTATEPLPVFRHIGLYGYRRDILQRLITLPTGPLEQAEQLEQLRALEHGISIRVVPVDYQGRTHAGIDSPQDLQRAEQLITSEGELLASYDGSIRWTA